MDLKNANFIAFSDFFFVFLGPAVVFKMGRPIMLKVQIFSWIIPWDSENQLCLASFIFSLFLNVVNCDGYFPIVFQNF